MKAISVEIQKKSDCTNLPLHAPQTYAKQCLCCWWAWGEAGKVVLRNANRFCNLTKIFVFKFSVSKLHKKYFL